MSQTREPPSESPGKGADEESPVARQSFAPSDSPMEKFRALARKVVSVPHAEILKAERRSKQKREKD